MLNSTDGGETNIVATAVVSMNKSLDIDSTLDWSTLAYVLPMSYNSSLRVLQAKERRLQNG